MSSSVQLSSGKTCVRTQPSLVLNDQQSRLNATRVSCVLEPQTVDELVSMVCRARKRGQTISVSGGRHAMGGQQFATASQHIDIRSLNRVVDVDTERGLATVEGGIMWPELIAELHRRQQGDIALWTIREKQTGVDRVTIAGSISANAHGRGLVTWPLVHDVVAIDVVTADGRIVHCSRTENSELFSLVAGGYGLFGIIVRATIQLVRRFKVCRRVEVIAVRDLIDGYRRRVSDGCVFGDCQYSVDLSCDVDSHPGVFACYEPVPISTPVVKPVALSESDWARLYRLVRTDKARAFREYAAHYQRTDGQSYWSDTHQLAGSFDGHRAAVDPAAGTEMITEAYVRHDDLVPFLGAVRGDFVDGDVDVSYGTIRFIEPDSESFLPWARERFACVVCNLHVRHTSDGRRKAARQFRRIIDRVVGFGGSFFLTYHRWASPQQVEACHPRVRDFFRLKREYDRPLLFQSDWYRHYASAF